MVGTVCYRVGQFLQALIARVPEEETEKAIRLLEPEARGLFRRQAIQDQHHALAVYQTLHRAGHTNPQLLAAALLHDAGKAAGRLSAWQRAVIVLLDRFAPHLLGHLSREHVQGHAQSGSAELTEVVPRSWRRHFAVHTRHPEIGALWAQEAGCAPLTVALIRRHQERRPDRQGEENEFLVALQAADGRN